MAAYIDKNLMKSIPLCDFKIGKHDVPPYGSLCNDRADSRAGWVLSAHCFFAAIVAPLAVKTLKQMTSPYSYAILVALPQMRSVAHWV